MNPNTNSTTDPNTENPDTVTIETRIRAPIDKVWKAWNTPDDIMKWNAATPDWHTTRSEVDLRVGGSFSSRMEAKDGSMGFDFAGSYVAIDPKRALHYRLGDEREVKIDFIDNGDGTVTVRERFDAEKTHSREMQQQGWQAILDNFRRYVEQQG